MKKLSFLLLLLSNVCFGQMLLVNGFKHRTSTGSTYTVDATNPNLINWYVAGDFTGTSIPDHSSHGFNTSAWNSIQPTLSGNKLVFYNSNQAYSNDTYANWAGSFTIYWVANETFGWGFGSYSNGGHWGFYDIGSSYGISVSSNGGLEYDYSGSQTGIAVWKVVIDQTTSAGNTITSMYKNGVLIDQHTIGGNTLTVSGMGIMLGAAGGGFDHVNGDFYEMLVYNELENSTNDAGIQSYLTSKYITVGPQTYDTNAQSFFTVNSGLNTTQKNAVNQLVVSLKDAGLWNKMQAIYPFIGGTADAHKWNLKDPRDLDAAFRLTFSPGGTNNSYGWNGNGSTWADTHFTPSVNWTDPAYTHMSLYSGTNISDGNYQDMGSYSVIGGSYYLARIVIKYSDGASYFSLNSNEDDIINTITDTRGFFVTTHNPQIDGAQRTYQNGVQKSFKFISGIYAPTSSISIGAMNGGGSVGDYSPKIYSFATIGTNLTPDEVGTFNTIVQAYQTSLSRAY